MLLHCCLSLLPNLTCFEFYSIAGEHYVHTKKVASWVIEVLSSLEDVLFASNTLADLKYTSAFALRRLKIDDPHIAAPFFVYSAEIAEKFVPLIYVYSNSPSRSAKEPMWTSFHGLRSHFRGKWTTFCDAIAIPIDPSQGVLGVHVAHQFFLRMIKSFSSGLTSNTPAHVTELTENELSGLFYVAGYVICSVRTSIKESDKAAVQRWALDSMCTFDLI